MVIRGGVKYKLDGGSLVSSSSMSSIPVLLEYEVYLLQDKLELSSLRLISKDISFTSLEGGQ